jgi:predicted Zn finger-like uncharacterized protein
MIVVCSQCSTRLQLDDAKVPSRSFTLRCPKCQNIIQAQPPTASNEQGALSVGDTPALESRRFNPPTAAPAFKSDKDIVKDEVDAYGDAATTAAPTDLARLLAELLQQSVGGAAAAAQKPMAARLKWERRRVLVCVTLARREPIGRALVDENYQVYIAEDTSQAIERMREEQMDVVILEPDFDAVEQGAAFVTSEINVLRPALRRRLLFVQTQRMWTNCPKCSNARCAISTTSTGTLTRRSISPRFSIREPEKTDKASTKPLSNQALCRRNFW